MADYIERKALLDSFKVDISRGDTDFVNLAVAVVRGVIQSQPAADVQEVVRCSKCIFANDDGTICRYGVGVAVMPNHYCGYGERKDGGEI